MAQLLSSNWIGVDIEFELALSTSTKVQTDALVWLPLTLMVSGGISGVPTSAPNPTV